MAFGPMGNLLAVGHANGDVAFWELKRTGWECVKALKGKSLLPACRLSQNGSLLRCSCACLKHPLRACA